MALFLECSYIEFTFIELYFNIILLYIQLYDNRLYLLSENYTAHRIAVYQRWQNKEITALAMGSVNSNVYSGWTVLSPP